MKGQIEIEESETSTSSSWSGSGLGRGLFQSHMSYDPTTDLDESGEHSVSSRWRPFSRKVGFQYSLQSFLNSLPLLIVDIVAIIFTIAACRELSILLDIKVGIDVSACLLPIAVGFVLLNLEFGLYPGVKLSPVEELRRLVVSISCIFVVWTLGVYMLTGGLGDNKWLLLGALYVSCLMTLPICRSWTRRMLGTYTNWGLPALVCGDDAAAVRVYHWLAENHHLGLRPVGVIGDRASLGAGPDDAWYAGTWKETIELADKHRVFWAIVVPPEDHAPALSSFIADYLYTIPQIHVLSELTGLPDHWNPQQLDGLSGIHLQQNLMLPLPRITKRVIDLVASILGGIALSPILFYLAVAVKMSSRGPIFYSQERVGRYGGRFQAWKFRSMFQGSNMLLEQYLEDNPELRPEWDAHQKLRYDPRITRIGRFLRKTSLDELPQLWNVFRGDMTLVGPRPMMPSQIEQYGVYYPLYTMVSPGITGLWQVSGRNEKTFEERAQLDAYYVRNWSPWLDVLLLIKTIRIVVFAKGAY